jgi:hypothetical protein
MRDGTWPVGDDVNDDDNFFGTQPVPAPPPPTPSDVTSGALADDEDAPTEDTYGQ